MNRADSLLQALIVLTLLAALCAMMSQVLTPPAECTIVAAAAAAGAVSRVQGCVEQFPPYPPKPGIELGVR
jgi:hypothetical protein